MAEAENTQPQLDRELPMQGTQDKVKELLGEAIDHAPVHAPADEPETTTDDVPERVPDLSMDGLGMDAPVDREIDTDGTFQALADKLELSLSDLYETPLKLDGDITLTLGELKDQAQDFARLGAERESFNDARMEHENEMLRARAELQEVIGLLPEIPPEVIQQAAQQHQASVNAERESLFAIRPEWRDEATFKIVRDNIATTLSEYGFSRAEADSFIDHRATKLLHDFHVMRERFKEAREGHTRTLEKVTNNRATKGDTKAAAKARRQQATQRIEDESQQGRPRKATTPGQRVRAVRDLLNSQEEMQ